METCDECGKSLPYMYVIIINKNMLNQSTKFYCSNACKNKILKKYRRSEQ
jgi:ssDNA-binding Zn-finger/Zn-ribbon topoisomerase 1